MTYQDLQVNYSLLKRQSLHLFHFFFDLKTKIRPIRLKVGHFQADKVTLSSHQTEYNLAFMSRLLLLSDLRTTTLFFLGLASLQNAISTATDWVTFKVRLSILKHSGLYREGCP